MAYKGSLTILAQPHSRGIQMQSRPILLTKEQLMTPIVAAQRKLEEIRRLAPLEKDAELFREGLFVLAFSTVEVMLSDVLTELFRKIPAKLPGKIFSVTKESLLAGQFGALDEQIQAYVADASYKRLDDYLGLFCQHLSIDIGAFRAEDGEVLLEIKESRNLLLHNNLRTNGIYLAKAGPRARSKHSDDQLPIDARYFSNSISVLLRLCAAIDKAIGEKYASYTKARAIRELWEYLFRSPVLTFDMCWEVIEAKDSVCLRTDDFRRASGSEQILIGIWLNHYSGSAHEYLDRFRIHGLDSETQEKALWLISSLRDFRLY